MQSLGATPRQCRVGRVEHKVVFEGELHLALDLAPGALLYKPSHLECVQCTVDVGYPPQPAQNAAPEHLPDHGGAEQRSPRVAGERVDAGS